MTSIVPRVEPASESSTVPIPGLANPIWLIRHASTSWTGRRWCGRADPPLNAAGRAQAHDLARVIGSAPDLAAGATIRTSPARRAHATARAIAKVTVWPVAKDDDLLEADVGLLEGLTWSQLEVGHPDLAAALVRGDRIDWPGGETITEVRDRASRAAERALGAAAECPVVVVSHGALLHALVGAIAPSTVHPFFAPGGTIRLVPDARG